MQNQEYNWFIINKKHAHKFITKSMCFKPIQVILRGAFVFYNNYYCGLWGGGRGRRGWKTKTLVKFIDN